MNVETTEHYEEPTARLSGILLHPTSLPSPYGIGDLGQEAYEFVDFLKRSGQHFWQMLPLTQTGYCNSPYKSYSAFAGQPLLIDPRHLVRLNLLTQEDLKDMPAAHPRKVDYDSVILYKNRLLHKSQDAFLHHAAPALLKEFENFCTEHQDWLDDYALFMTCMDYYKDLDWQNWEKDCQTTIRLQQKKEIHYYKYIQFLFFKEWFLLKEYANQNGVKIIGDIPIFVSLDSADVWMNQDLFQLDDSGYPLKISGVPPDYFSATGQLWGNPLYDWDAMKAKDYSWWILRIRNRLKLFDYVRIDHFRGFEAYWSTPYGAENAMGGTWVKGPGADFFYALEQALGEHLPIIAEDLGMITPEVEKLRDLFHYPGMKVLQFGFDCEGESTFLPHHFTTTNCACYTGTHDNDTVSGWYETASEYSRDKVRRYMNTDGNNISYDFIRTCLGSIAAYAIFPLQDVLRLGKDARMNRPGIALGNWEWRYTKEDLTPNLADELRALTHLFGRY